MIVLDTDILIEIMDKKSKKGDEVLKKLIDMGENRGENVVTTAINLHEITYGLLKYDKKVEELKALKILEFKRGDAELSAKLEVELEKQEENIGRLDSMIAAITINNDAKLLTFNISHFERLRKFGLEILTLN